MKVRIKNPDALAAILDAKVEEYAQFILTRASENIVKNETTDTGALLQSGTVEKTGIARRRVVYYVGYATAIEYGSDPHLPPVEALEGWVGRKLHVPEDEVRRAAWAVAKKIEKEGTEPQPFLRPAITEFKVRYGK